MTSPKISLDRVLGFQGGQALTDGKFGQVGHTVDIQFFHDLVPVGLGRFGADVQPVGDFLGPQSLGYQLEDLSLPP